MASQGNHKKLNIEWKYIYRGACQLILTIIAGGSFFYVWQRFTWHFTSQEIRSWYLAGPGNMLMSLMIYIGIYTLIGHWMRAFAIGVERVSNIIASQVITLFLTDFCEVFISMAVTGRGTFWPLFLSKYMRLLLPQIIVICLCAFIMIMIYRKVFPPIEILEVHGRENGLCTKVDALEFKYHIAESIDVEQTDLGYVNEKIRDCEAVLINDMSARKRNKILKTCFKLDKRVYVVPKISDVIMKNSEALNLFDTPMYLCRNREITWWQRIIKRGADIIFSMMALIILSPVLVATAVAIKIEDKGPVIYKQERVTRDNRRFMMLKFRSMIVNAESDGKPHPAGENDPRITKVGRFIRTCRIDELPQLINILKGDMSIVGPRPERVEHAEKYSKMIPEFDFRLKMKGGLTGYAQVYGKYNTTPLDKLKLDLTYITNYSLLMDVQIIFETIKIIFLKESTEGFKESDVALSRGSNVDDKGKGGLT